MIKPAISAAKRAPSAHGGGVRGDNSAAQSTLFEGRFGRMFRSLLSAEWPVEALQALGKQMLAEPETFAEDPKLPAAKREIADKIHDEEENSGIAAGYTYLGQFIDHDITFDPASSLQQLNDPDGLVDYRTPRLDLDSLYGRGPDDQPYMYDDEGRKFRLGRSLSENGYYSKARDLPRYISPFNEHKSARALIGDKRNDENIIISQLHGAMLQFHNKLADIHGKASFREVQRLVRWHYQWIVANDFLPVICGPSTVEKILPQLAKGGPIWDNKANFALYRYHEDPYMPIEFSAAAYRFGHSMVRPIYRLNTRLSGGDDPLKATPAEVAQGIDGRHFIFAGVQKRGLNGFGLFPEEWAIDWSLFFDIGGSGGKGGRLRVQPSYKIDTSLVNPLRFLPEFSNAPIAGVKPLTVKQLQCVPTNEAKDPANLAVRNLLRGMAMGLPSGQAVAESLGIQPIKDCNLRIGKAVVEEWPKSPSLAAIHPSFRGNAPLWFYVLAEAQYEWMKRLERPGSAGDKEPLTLGTVGGRIVAETLLGLLWGDKHSFIRQAPNWKPEKIRTMGDLIGFALS